jgi:hypothetical protein
MQRRLTGFNISDEVRAAIVETKDEIAELNRGQMFVGKRSDGSDITPSYSPFTVEIKDQKGQPSDRVTLKDTGAFWESIKVDVNSDSFTIDASDSKTNALTKKYGNNILGLSKESKYDEYIPNYFFPALKARIQRKLGFKFS